MSSVSIDAVIINRPERQRRKLVSIEELASSIQRTNGPIHPPVITRDNTLVAGERRIEAMRHLGYTTIPVVYTDELDPTQLHLIELEENIQRVDLPWQDEVEAVASYHKLRVELAKREGAKPWREEDTGNSLGVTKVSANLYIRLANELASGNMLVRDAQNLSVAKGLMIRSEDRRRTSALSELVDPVAADVYVSPEATSPIGVVLKEQVNPTPAPAPTPILTADFREWAPEYIGPKFNFFHCDFPYGINADKRKQGNSVARHGGYNDSPDVYWELLGTLATNMDRLAAPSAHILFWFSMDYYTETLGYFARFLPDWTIQPFPIYWSKSDNVGLLPDPKRGPRRVVETALIGSRGDRLIVQAVANHIAHATDRRSGHISIKPEPVLRHFFRMFVDENTSMLDPTCGSASSLRAARALNATRSVGLEQNPEFADLARRLWRGEEVGEVG